MPTDPRHRSLDPTDIAILAALYADARLTNKALAEQVGLSPSSCLERVRRLQQDNIVQGCSLHVDYTALGGHIQAMIAVRMAKQSRDVFDRFQDAMLEHPEVLAIFHMGGANDFQIHVTVSDTMHLRDFVFNGITALDDVVHVETALVYEHKVSKRLPSF